MSHFRFATGAVAGLILGGAAFAQNTNSTGAAGKPQDASTQTAPAQSVVKLSPEELELRFKTTLTNATLAGRWCMIQDGKMGADQEDKYTIQDISKVGGDLWMVHAHIQYGQRDVIAPIPVQIKWAGDTPVLIMDNLGIPGGGTYTARVLFYGNTYSGTWSGGTRGGLLHGVITHPKE